MRTCSEFETLVSKSICGFALARGIHWAVIRPVEPTLALMRVVSPSASSFCTTCFGLIVTVWSARGTVSSKLVMPTCGVVSCRLRPCGEVRTRATSSMVTVCSPASEKSNWYLPLPVPCSRTLPLSDSILPIAASPNVTGTLTHGLPVTRTDISTATRATSPSTVAL